LQLRSLFSTRPSRDSHACSIRPCRRLGLPSERAVINCRRPMNPNVQTREAVASYRTPKHFLHLNAQWWRKPVRSALVTKDGEPLPRLPSLDLPDSPYPVANSNEKFLP
jgi:hypothetical protein